MISARTSVAAMRPLKLDNARLMDVAVPTNLACGLTRVGAPVAWREPGPA
jgi:hypothetical protein